MQVELRQEQSQLDIMSDDYRRSTREIEESYEALNELRDGIFQTIGDKQAELFHALGSLPYASEDDYREALTELEKYGEAIDSVVREKTHDLDEQLDYLEADYRKRYNAQEDKINSLRTQIYKAEEEQSKKGR